ncbi:MAG: NHL repeat-containing protein, partial [Candidatus Colwellbacteria bacterium]|nr:NHL repeat-containing protein [Candidatus Colwellbacteria bacterium]
MLSSCSLIKTQPEKGVAEKPTERDDFSCFSSCKYFPEGFPRQMCEDWKAGKQVQWPDCSSMSAFPACKKLCESEMKNNSQSNDGSFQQNYTQQQSQQPNGGSPQQNYCPSSGISKDENPDNAYLYIADLGKHRLIRMDDMGGTGWVSFGSLGEGVNQFNEPKQLARDKQGRIYISDQINARIVRIDDITGKGWVSYAPPSDRGHGQRVWGVDLDSKDRIYFTLPAGGIGRIDDMSGKGLVKFGEVWGSGVNQFNVTKVVQIDQEDRIYIGDSLNERVVRIDDMTGKNWISFGKLGTGIGEFQRTSGYAFDSQGRIYIADEDNNRIVRIDDMTGKGWIEFHGIDGDPLRLPNGIKISKSGRFYISDTRNNRVVRIDDMTGKGWKVYGFCRELGPEGDPNRENPYQMLAPKA